MACKNICRLCDKLIISTAVTFTGGNLVITIPEGAYNNCGKYCIVIAQTIPATATINAPVVIQVGTGPVLYPLTNCNGTQVTASGIRTRTKYATRVHTSADTGTFRLLGNVCCASGDNLRALDGDGTPVATAGEEA